MRTGPRRTRLDTQRIGKEDLQRLVQNSSVVRFKGKDGKDHYSIPKGIYDRFLMRKKPVVKEEPKLRRAQGPDGAEDDNIADLQNKGFIVLQTEAEASKVSLLLSRA